MHLERLNPSISVSFQTLNKNTWMERAFISWGSSVLITTNSFSLQQCGEVWKGRCSLTENEGVAHL